MNFKDLILLLFIAILNIEQGSGQPVNQHQNVMNKQWHLEALSDSNYGVSMAKALDHVKKRQPVPVVIAVIDAGVNINHEAIKDAIWINTF